MNRFKLCFLTVVFVLSSLACGGGGSNEESGHAVVIESAKVVINTEAVEPAETQEDNSSEEAETLSVEDVEVEELNTESEEAEEEEEGIDVATAEEDPLLLNSKAALMMTGLSSSEHLANLVLMEKPLTRVHLLLNTSNHFRNALPKATY